MERTEKLVTEKEKQPLLGEGQERGRARSEGRDKKEVEGATGDKR